MFSGLGLAPLVLIFAAAAGAIWVDGIHLSSATDSLDMRLGLGEAIGGVVLLALATNLPEIAITSSAAFAAPHRAVRSSRAATRRPRRSRSWAASAGPPGSSG